jgi:hypothetical protein
LPHTQVVAEVVAVDAAGRDELHARVRVRRGEALEVARATRGPGREELEHLEPEAEARLDVARGHHARREREAELERLLDDRGIEPRRDAEHRARVGGPAEVVHRQDRPGADHHVGSLLPELLHDPSRGLGAEGDLGDRKSALRERIGERHGRVDALDRHDRDYPDLTELLVHGCDIHRRPLSPVR